MIRLGVTLGILTLFAAGLACGGPARGGRRADSQGGLDIERAGLPYRVLRADGHEVDRAEFFTSLSSARAICVGESHTNPHHHWAQLEILRELSKNAATGLGMEMFQRPFQGVVDDFARGDISESELLSRSGWKERWGYDWQLYAPMVRLVAKRGGHLVALNVSSELKKKVSRKGLEGLTEAERQQLPEMDLDDAEHRAWFDAIMEEMGGATGHQDENDEKADPQPEPAKTGEEHAASPPSPEQTSATSAADRIYSVQVLWDETMAETAARWLEEDPARRLLILAGNGHCNSLGIIKRLKRRGVDRSVSVQPVIDGGEGEVAALLAEPENDFLFVMTTERELSSD